MAATPGLSFGQILFNPANLPSCLNSSLCHHLDSGQHQPPKEIHFSLTQKSNEIKRFRFYSWPLVHQMTPLAVGLLLNRIHLLKEIELFLFLMLMYTGDSSLHCVTFWATLISSLNYPCSSLMASFSTFL
jgi:hypothetical protein